MRWNMASPGAGTVRGLDSLLGVLQYKDAQKKRDERLEAEKIERETIRAEEKKRHDELMNIEKLKFQKGSFTALAHSMKEYLDPENDTKWESVESGLDKIGTKFDEASPGLGDPFNAVVKNAPARVRTKNPITGQETYFSDEELEEQRKKYAEEVYLRSIAGVQSLGGDIEKGETKFGKRTQYKLGKDGSVATREPKTKEAFEKNKEEGFTENKPVESNWEDVPFFYEKDGKNVSINARNKEEFDRFSADEKYTRGKLDSKGKVKNQTITDENGNVTNIIFNEDGTVKSTETVDANGKPVGRAGKFSPSTPAEKTAEQKRKQHQDNLNKVTQPKFKEDAINVLKKTIGAEWDTYTEQEKDNKIKLEIDKQIKTMFPDAIHGVNEDGVIGYFDKDGNLIRADD